MGEKSHRINVVVLRLLLLLLLLRHMHAQTSDDGRFDAIQLNNSSVLFAAFCVQKNTRTSTARTTDVIPVWMTVLPCAWARSTQSAAALINRMINKFQNGCLTFRADDEAC